MSIKGHRRRKLLRVLSDAPGAPMEGLPPSAQAVSCFPVVCRCCGDRRESPPLVPFLPLSETAPPKKVPFALAVAVARSCPAQTSRTLDFSLCKDRGLGAAWLPHPLSCGGQRPLPTTGATEAFAALSRPTRPLCPGLGEQGCGASAWAAAAAPAGGVSGSRLGQCLPGVGVGVVWAPESWGLSPPCSQENPVIMACPLSPSACSQPASCSRAP